MTDRLEYLGPLDRLAVRRPRINFASRSFVAFCVVVVLPTVFAAIYYLLIAAPQYVSEARFIVRAPSQDRPSGFDVALQGVGLSSTQTDVFAVHEYIDSRDGMTDLRSKVDLKGMLGRPKVDFIARFPRPLGSQNDEALFEAYRRFVTVGYDSTKGISTLRVHAFAARDAQAISIALLDGGERLVNRLNDRAYSNAIKESEGAVIRAEERLVQAQSELAAFRNREQFIDPSRTALEGTSLIGDLMGQVATLRAERAQIAAQASNSPQLPTVDARIAAFERQIEVERAKLAGATSSLAPKIGVYERLVLNREMADRAVAQARMAHDAAEQQARSQKLYLQRVVEPRLADAPTYPKRFIAILAVFATALAMFGMGWLVVASVSEHRQS
ncbi:MULTISPECIES: chain-length determining protein [Brevundimonas]|jgi:capsular polysaccharide transport system permease protein|uniref:chain-length determining protein n=1 Tax=Brevundimonas sp. ZS04 TaxID=1906854 RepID=UPI00096FFBDA|nr:MULTISPECIES: chain-length determining protein [Brevundimonas]OMG55307.1 chain-length determining protein [Brevundimonas sp. ZS04]